MPFPTHLLTDDEELVLDLRPHWWFLAPVGSVLALVTIGAVAALVAQWWAPLEWAVLAVWIGTLAWFGWVYTCLLYTSPSPRDATLSRMPSSA